MNKTSLFCLTALLVCLSACSHKELSDNQVLIADLTHFDEARKETNLSDLFKGVKLVQLETNDSCLVDRNGKVVRYDSIYYVQSANDILMFDTDGHYLRTLSKAGNGPGEYPQIYDYNIVARADTTEIWISSIGGIYIYHPQTLAFKRRIPIEGFVNQFHYVNDRTILTVKPEDIIFKIYDMEGNLRKEGVKKDLANSTQMIAQFSEYKNLVLYKWDNTQEVVVYDEQADSLYMANLFPPQAGMVTSGINRKYYEQYGFMDQMAEVAQAYTTVPVLRTGKDEVILILSHPDRSRSIVLYKDGKDVTYSLSSNSPLKNDLVPTIGLNFLSTAISTLSDRGFLFLIGAERYTEGGSVEEENPLIVDICEINL